MVSIPFLSVVLLTAPAAVPTDDIRQRAEAAFQEGVKATPTAPDAARAHFAEAARLYGELRSQGANNAALYRNQGNAHLLAGDLPRAVLAYRRGLRLAPHDIDLRQNLGIARSEVVRPPPGQLGRPPVDHRPPWLPRLPNWLSTVALALYSFAWLACARWWMVRRGRWLLTGGIALSLALVTGGALALEDAHEQEEGRRPLVVIADDGVLLRGGNGLEYPTRYETPLNRGVEARLLFERGEWLQIELSGGEVGWVPRRYAIRDAD